jgi:uncharacterized HAD superfamily protein
MQIKLDKENKILSIQDNGVGMTKEDLIKNIGTILKNLDLQVLLFPTYCCVLRLFEISDAYKWYP